MKLLHELTREELKTLYEKNHDFQSQIWESVYADNMYWQSEEYKQLFGEDNRAIEYHDHYTSFYLTIRNHDIFIENINDPDLLIESNRKLYDKAKELAEKWNNMDYDEQDENGEVYDELEKVQNELIDGITEQLRAYEDISDDQIDQKLEDISENINGMGEWETDGERIYQTIVKTYK